MVLLLVCKREILFMFKIALNLRPLFLESSKFVAGIYNIGSGEANSFQKVAEIIQKKFSDAKIEYIDMPEGMTGSYQAYTKANIDKIMGLFPNFKISSFEDGVRSYLEYLDEQKMRFS